MKRAKRVVAGATVRVGSTEVTPLATVQETVLSGPGFGAERASIRPTAIEVTRDDGFSQVVRIPNPLRWQRLSALAVLVFLTMRRRR